MVLATGLERSQKWSKNESIGDLTGACADMKKAIKLGSNSSVKWVASNCN